MNRRVQYAKIVHYLASRGVCEDLPKRYAASLDPNEDYEFEDMTPLELEVYSSALSQLMDNAHEVMDTAQIYREMMFIDTLLKGSSTSWKQIKSSPTWQPHKIVAPQRHDPLREKYGEPKGVMFNGEKVLFYPKAWHAAWYEDPENEAYGTLAASMRLDDNDLDEDNIFGIELSFYDVGACNHPWCDVCINNAKARGDESYVKRMLEEQVGKTDKTAFQKFAPYGIPKDKGGDSKTNDAKMEDCVAKLMKKGHDKESAIRICKKSLGFTKDN